MSRPAWVAYSEADAAAWAADLSPDKTGSERWTGAADGCLVVVSPVKIGGHGWFLPMVHLRGKWLQAEQAFPTRERARRDATETYSVNAKYRGILTDP